MSDQELCPCGCHKQEGFFHCWTGPCCKTTNTIGEIYRPKLLPLQNKPGEFKGTFIFPNIKQPWPNLIAEELVKTQPMESDIFKEGK